VAAETRTSHRVTRVRVAPAPAPRSLSRQVRDTPLQGNVGHCRSNFEADARGGDVKTRTDRHVLEPCEPPKTYHKGSGMLLTPYCSVKSAISTRLHFQQ